MPRRLACLFLLLLPCLAPVAPCAAAAAPAVVVSIKPLHSLVARLMQGLGEPQLLVAGAASLHEFSLRPSQAAALEAADLVVWVGPALESFLAGALPELAPQAAVVEAMTLPGILLLPPREGGLWEAESEDHDHAAAEGAEPQAAGEIDGHLFLDPGNALVIAAAAARQLAALDPANAASYAANLEGLRAELAALDAELAATLAPVKGRRFVVFHDAYQYFEAHYGLAAAGAVTVSPGHPPGARRLDEIRRHLLAAGAVCIFAEPDFEPALIEAVVQGTAVRSGLLDPEGTALQAGPSAYGELLRELAQGLAGCLAAG